MIIDDLTSWWCSRNKNYHDEALKNGERVLMFHSFTYKKWVLPTKLPFSISKKVRFTYQKTVIFHRQALVLRSPPRRQGSACDARAPQVRSMAGRQLGISSR